MKTLKLWEGEIVITKNNAIKWLEEYREKEEFPTFSGLLLHLGLTPKDYKESTGKGKEILELYKFSLEVEMEKLLRYQNGPKDKWGKNAFDLRFIEKLLIKSNPEEWGQKLMVAPVVNKLDAKVATLKEDIRNESGISLRAKIC